MDDEFENVNPFPTTDKQPISTFSKITSLGLGNVIVYFWHYRDEIHSKYSGMWYSVSGEKTVIIKWQ